MLSFPLPSTAIPRTQRLASPEKVGFDLSARKTKTHLSKQVLPCRVSSKRGHPTSQAWAVIKNIRARLAPGSGQVYNCKNHASSHKVLPPSRIKLTEKKAITLAKASLQHGEEDLVCALEGWQLQFRIQVVFQFSVATHKKYLKTYFSTASSLPPGR